MPREEDMVHFVDPKVGEYGKEEGGVSGLTFHVCFRGIRRYTSGSDGRLYGVEEVILFNGRG